MDTKAKLEIINTKGEKQQVEVVASFSLEQTGKKYILYTQNQKKDNMVILYASCMIEKNGQIIFDNLSDEEWILVKNKMREIIYSGGGNS